MENMQSMMEHMQGMMENMQGMMEHMQGMRGGSGMMGRQSMMAGGGMMGRRGMSMMGQEEEDEEEDSPQRGMMGRRGMMARRGVMGTGGMMGHSGVIQHHLERLAQQLDLTNEQRTQMWPLLSTHAKEAIRLKADIETLGIDLRQLLEAEPVDLPRVKQVLQTMAGKEADLRLGHITAMEEMGKVLTPEQRQKLRAMRRSMMGHGGMIGRARSER
jgi:Spy/CpxP family protein refolding chaperone